MKNYINIFTRLCALYGYMHYPEHVRKNRIFDCIASRASRGVKRLFSIVNFGEI